MIEEAKDEERNAMPSGSESDSIKEAANLGLEELDFERIKRRVAKYSAKTRPARMSTADRARWDRMRTNYLVQLEVMERVERVVAGVTDKEGILPCMRFWYKNFGREIYRIWRTKPLSCQPTEYFVSRCKWTMRGLSDDLLEEIRAAVVMMLDASGFPRKHEEPLIWDEPKVE